MWETMTLEKVCKIISGNSIPAKKKEEHYTNVEGMPYVATKDVGFNGAINYENGVFIPDEYLSGFKISPAFATLVCAEGGSAGRKIAFSTEECCFVNKLFSLQPNENIVPKFIYYYTLGEKFQSQFKEAMHGLIGGVSLSKIKDFYISPPPIAEQQRIVAKLDAAFAEIDEAIRFTNGKEDEVVKLRASLLSNNLTDNALIWSNVKLKDVVTYEKVNAQGSSLPYLGMENISSNTMKIVDELEIPTSTSSTFKFDETHVLYGRLRPYLKKVLVPNFEGQCSTEVFCLKPSSNLNRKFLAYWLLSPNIADKIENTSTGARMPRANMNAILEFNFFLPSPDEQQHIVAKLDAACAEIEAAHIAIKKKKENFEALKSAILAQELQSEAA